MFRHDKHSMAYNSQYNTNPRRVIRLTGAWLCLQNVFVPAITLQTECARNRLHCGRTSFHSTHKGWTRQSNVIRIIRIPTAGTSDLANFDSRSAFLFILSRWQPSRAAGNEWQFICNLLNKDQRWKYQHLTTPQHWPFNSTPPAQVSNCKWCYDAIVRSSDATLILQGCPITGSRNRMKQEHAMKVMKLLLNINLWKFETNKAVAFTDRRLFSGVL
jgi:hypothetical protein